MPTVQGGIYFQAYIAPFALQTPFELRLDDSASTNDSTTSARLKPTKQLNNLLNELQVLWKDELPSSPKRETFPEQGKWIIFCATRLTFIFRATIGDCNWWDLLANTSNELGSYVVIPSSLALKLDIIARMRELSPAAVPYGTPAEAQKAAKYCSQCGCGIQTACVRSLHFSQQLFHIKGNRRHPDIRASGRSRLVIWIPGIALPWELALPSETDPTTYITGLFQWALKEFALGSTTANIVTNLVALGYYPTPDNWMLMDFSSATQIHSSSVPQWGVPEKKTLAYIVGSMHCGTLTKEMVAVLNEKGALGWLKFWEDIVAGSSASTPAISVAG